MNLTWVGYFNRPSPELTHFNIDSGLELTFKTTFQYCKPLMLNSETEHISLGVYRPGSMSRGQI